ncbi:MAG: recombinase family protein [Deltaproteobacteria bacterium]|nr:recombinase family protein [Deltaproteobacteria bacterium]
MTATRTGVAETGYANHPSASSSSFSPTCSPSGRSGSVVAETKGITSTSQIQPSPQSSLRPQFSPGLSALPILKLPLIERPTPALVLAYGRYSSENQNAGSADAQIEMIESAVAANRVPVRNPLLLGVEQRLAGFVKDEAISGTRVSREGIELVEWLITTHRVHAVCVLDLSRSTRLVERTIWLRNLARFHHVEFVSLSENTSSYDDSSKPLFFVQGLVNELSNDQRREATVAHMTVRTAAGYSHGSLPYGYVSEATRQEDRKGKEVKSHFAIKIHPERAAVVCQIFEWYGRNGLGVKKIVARLNEMKIPSPGPSHRREGLVGAWSFTTVNLLLKNPRYAGMWFWRMRRNEVDPATGRRVQRALPQSEWVPMGGDDGFREDLRIVPQDMWEAVQRTLADITRRRAQGKTPAERRWGCRKSSEADHLLSGLLCCGTCGDGNLVLSSGKAGGYYQCFNAGKGTCENKRHVPLRKLEAAVVAVVAELLDDKLAAEVADRTNAKLRQRLAEDPNSIERLRVERQKLERKVQNYLDFAGDGDNSPALRERLHETEARLTQVSGDLLRAEALRRDPVLVTPFLVREQLRDLVAVLRSDPGRSRGVLRSLFPERITVRVQEDGVWVLGKLAVDADGSTVVREFRVALA